MSKTKILLTGNSDIVIYNFRKELIGRLLNEKRKDDILFSFEVK